MADHCGAPAATFREGECTIFIVATCAGSLSFEFCAAFTHSTIADIREFLSRYPRIFTWRIDGKKPREAPCSRDCLSKARQRGALPRPPPEGKFARLGLTCLKRRIIAHGELVVGMAGGGNQLFE